MKDKAVITYIKNGIELSRIEKLQFLNIDENQVV